MKSSMVFMKALANVPQDVKIQVDLSMGIADRIVAILKSKNLSQKEFAKLMGKTEAEVSRWVGGTHNFTLCTLAKISAVLNEPIIKVSSSYLQTYEQDSSLVAEE